MSTISKLFVCQFVSRTFCHKEFDKEAISDGCGVKMPGIGEMFWILSDLKNLSFFGPCGPRF